MGNRINRVYTRTGDYGTTQLGDGSRLDKFSLRINAIGDVDELNSCMGIVLTQQLAEDISEHFINIQHVLFDIGGELSLPGESIINERNVQDLERLIDNYNRDLPPLKEFILPGGSTTGALCHFARTICRRAERQLAALSRHEVVNKYTLMYINRLSDFLFVVARVINRGDNVREQYWKKNSSDR